MNRDVVSFCRICEPSCGLVLQVERGRITSVRPDPENPFSRGFMCTKAPALAEVGEDPDRVLSPLERTGGPGEFRAVSWDQALEGIARRLKALVAEHGPEAFAVFTGNPPSFNAGALMAVDGLQKAIGSPWKYGVNGEDSGATTAAAALVFGSPALLPKPDLWRTQFLLVIGANPFVSHGSLFSEPQLRDAIDGIVRRGGRVVVVDPRRTETARRYEHVAVRAGTDAWLLLGLLKTILSRDLVDREFCERRTNGLGRLRELVASFDVRECAERSDVSVERIEELAVALASAPSAVVYGRTGTCTQRFGTLTNALQLILSCVTGNLERAGGSVFGWAAIDLVRFTRAAGLDTYGKVRTRVRGLPDSVGKLPSQGLIPDIVTPGRGQIRSLLLVGANPVLSSGAGGPEMENALESLDLLFSLDLYVNETNKHAHYVLPVVAPFERWDFPLVALGLMLRPALFATPAVIEPPGETREEWVILNDLARRMGLGGAYKAAPLRWLARFGLPISPRTIVDLLLRTGPAGDLFGLRPKGWSLAKLARHPHGVLLHERLPLADLDRVLQTPDKRVQLAPAELERELERLVAQVDDGRFPLRVIGLREIRSHNSWMHNVPRLVPEDRHPAALVHPEAAATAGISDGERMRIESATGAISIVARVTDEVRPDTIAVPHGWGHAGGWKRANAAGGASSNELASGREEDVERLAGMSILNGIPVRIARADSAAKEV